MKKKWCSLMLSLALLWSVVSPMSVFSAGSVSTLAEEDTSTAVAEGITLIDDVATTYFTPTAMEGQDASTAPAPSGNGTSFTLNGEYTGNNHRMYLQVDGTQMVGDGIVFTVEVESDAVANMVTSVLAVHLLRSLQNVALASGGIIANKGTITELGDYRYQIKVPYSAFTYDKPSNSNAPNNTDTGIKTGTTFDPKNHDGIADNDDIPETDSITTYYLIFNFGGTLSVENETLSFSDFGVYNETQIDPNFISVVPDEVFGQDFPANSGNPVYTTTSDTTSGIYTATFAQDFTTEAWASTPWQTKLYFKLQGSNMLKGSGLSFTIKGSSDTVAEKIASGLTVQFQSAPGVAFSPALNAGACTGEALGNNTYRYRISFDQFNEGFTPVSGTTYYLTFMYDASAVGENVQGESLTFSNLGIYLSGGSVNSTTVLVRSENGGKVAAAVTASGEGARSYTDAFYASIDLQNGATLTLTAEGNSDYQFKEWKKINGDTSATLTSNPLFITNPAAGDVYTAVYEEASLPIEPQEDEVWWNSDNGGGKAFTIAYGPDTEDMKNKLVRNLGGTRLINRISLNEVRPSAGNYASVNDFHIDILKDGEWVEVYDNDFILTNRVCILDEDVETSAVRLVIDNRVVVNTSTGNKRGVTIDYFHVDYQERVDNPGFMNVGYFGRQAYQTATPMAMFSNTLDQGNTLTDAILIENFQYDKDGNFAVWEDNGNTADDSAGLDPEVEGLELARTWVNNLKARYINMSSGRTRMWFSLTARKIPSNLNGGSEDTRAIYSGAFLNADTREAFADSVVKFALELDMYGVDLDWEYPLTTSSQNAFNALVATLAEKLHAAGLKFSCTICPGNGYRNFLTKASLNAIDYLSYMMYTNTNYAPTYDLAQIPYEQMCIVIDEAITKSGDANYASKIWLGLPYFGKVSGTPALTYLNLYAQYKSDHGGYSSDAVPPKGLNVITVNGTNYYYNGIYLMQDKVAYAVDKGLAGVMAWWTGQDIKAFGEGDVQTGSYPGLSVTNLKMTGEDSLVYNVYDTIKRFTGLDMLSADYSAVDKLLEQVDELDSSLYTEESWTVLEEALEVAHNLDRGLRLDKTTGMNDTSKIQEQQAIVDQIQAVVDQLQEALADLELRGLPSTH